MTATYRWTSEECAYLRELLKSPMSWRRRAEEMNKKFPERYRSWNSCQVRSTIMLREDTSRKLIECLTGMLESADNEVGICCCGDSMDRHSSPMDCGHMPVDMGSYNAGLLIKEAREFLARKA